VNHVEDFLDFLKYQRGLSENTIRGYQYDISAFTQWLELRGTEFTAVKIRDIDAFCIYLRKERSNSISSVNRKMICLRTFFKYLMRSEIVDRNPFDFVTSIRATKALPKFLTLPQQEALLLASLNGEYREAAWLTKRDHLMMLVFLDCGLRVSELVGIEIKNIDLEEGILTVMGKGRKERISVLSNRLVTAIKEYLEMVTNSNLDRTVGPGLASRGFTLQRVCKEMGVSCGTASNDLCYGLSTGLLKRIRSFIEETIMGLPIKFLFFNQHGEPLDSRHAFRVVQEIGRLAGIENLHPHVLRHTFATNLRRKRCDLLLLSEALGHANVATTQIYAHVENQDYRDRLRELVN
jgi:site-specific recombinase XerD